MTILKAFRDSYTHDLFFKVPNSIILLKIAHTTKYMVTTTYMDVCPNHMLEFKFLLHLNSLTTVSYFGLRNIVTASSYLNTKT